MPGSAFINILSDEKNDEYFHGIISEDFLKIHLGDLNKKFYVCGPPPMTDAVLKQLAGLVSERIQLPWSYDISEFRHSFNLSNPVLK